MQLADLVADGADVELLDGAADGGAPMAAPPAPAATISSISYGAVARPPGASTSLGARPSRGQDDPRPAGVALQPRFAQLERGEGLGGREEARIDLEIRPLRYGWCKPRWQPDFTGGGGARPQEPVTSAKTSGLARARGERLDRPQIRPCKLALVPIRRLPRMARAKIALIGAGMIGGTLAHIGRARRTGRHRPVRHRRGHPPGQGAGHRRSLAGVRQGQPAEGRQRLRRHRRRRRLHRHRRRAAQAGHEPRRPAWASTSRS